MEQKDSRRAISNMHIRASWRELDDHDNYKTVSTLCGKRSPRRLVGIPGITQGQPISFRDAKGTKRQGWCWVCMQVIFHDFIQSDKRMQTLVPEVAAAQKLVWDEVGKYFEAYPIRRL